MSVNNAEPKLTSAIVCSPAIRERHWRSRPIATPSRAANPTRTSNSSPGWSTSMSSIFTLVARVGVCFFAFVGYV
jgi:hypothetical protein